MAQKKKSNITIANLVSIVGLVLFLAFSTVGHTYISGGEFGWDILIPLAFTAAIAVLLIVLIRVKGAENDLKKWKILEGVLLIVYIGVAYWSLAQGGIMCFFNANSDKAAMKECADADLQKIDALFKDYKTYEEGALETTKNGLTNASHGTSSDRLKRWADNGHIELNTRSIGTYIDSQHDDFLFGDEYEDFKKERERKKEDIRAAIVAWNILTLGGQAISLTNLRRDVEKKLTDLSQKADLPVIVPVSGYTYDLGEKQCKEYKIAGALQFPDKLKGLNFFNGWAVIAIIFIHLLILFNYFVAYRTQVLGPRKDTEDDGGQIIPN